MEDISQLYNVGKSMQILPILPITAAGSEYTKEMFKFLNISETGAPYFSLSDCSMETARSIYHSS